LVVSLLLKAGADPNLTNHQGRTALHFSCEKWNNPKSEKIASLLLEAGAKPNHQNVRGETPLHLASSANVVSLLLEAGADPNIQRMLGHTPLHDFIDQHSHAPDSSKIVSLYLEAGADPHVPNYQEMTPFQIARKEEIKTLFAEYETKQLTKALEDSPEPIQSAPIRVRM